MVWMAAELGVEWGTAAVPAEVDLSRAGVERVRRAARLLRAVVAAVPAEVDLSRAGVERVRRAARLLRAVVAAEAARGQEAPEFRHSPF